MIGGCSRAYLPKQDATVFAEVQSVAVLLLHGVVLQQTEVHQLPVHVIILVYDQIPTKLRFWKPTEKRRHVIRALI